MIRNYLLMAFRNLTRHRAFAIINILGLAIGIASCILLFLVLRYELSYDQFLPGHQQIYHVVTKQQYSDRVHYQGGVPTPALDALRADFPEIRTGALYANHGGQVTVLGRDPNIASDKKYIEQDGLMFADPEFFEVFPYRWLAGSPETLSEPNKVALSQKAAERYFNNWKDAVGQYILIDNTLTMEVSGIIENPPANSDFPIDVAASLITSRNNPDLYGYYGEWGSISSQFQVFIRLPEGMKEADIRERLISFSKKYYPPNPQSVKTNFLQPLSDIHFNSDIDSFGDHSISKSTLWTLSLIGIFIILMACINFINISTAQAVNRSREIGIRKVLGGRRSDLFGQMMGEAGLTVLISSLIGLLLAIICIPYLSYIASIPEDLAVITPSVLSFLAILTILVTLFAGSYPSLVISGFNPLTALKNKISSATVAGVSLRRGLVVLQFAISQVLIIGTIVAVSQMNAIRRADLGLSRDAVLVINSNVDSISLSRQEAFKTALLQTSGVESVSFSSDAPSSENNWSNNFSFDHQPDEKFHVFLKYADQDYFKTYGIRFLAGRPLAKSDTTNEVVVNETLLHKLGAASAAEIVGKDIRIGAGRWNRIVGVTKDFRTNSFKEETKPLYIASRRDVYGTTGIKMNSRNILQTRAAVDELWNKYYPEYANTASFLDERINAFYEQENQLALVYKVFAGIAIFISCLGLYGLVSFMAIQRTREVGIRKTLGASVQQIVYLFSKEFTVLVLIAFLIAAPLAWYFMNKWLQNFTYRVPLGIGIFAGAILLSLAIAWITVAYKSIRAALANPVKSLRNE